MSEKRGTVRSSWSNGTVVTCLLVSTTFRRTPKQTRDPLLFRIGGLMFHLFHLFLRSNTSQVVCPRSPQAIGSPVLTYAHLGSKNEAYDILQSCFASDLSITQTPRVFSDPLHKDRHTYSTFLSVIVQRLEAPGKRFPLFCSILQSLMQNHCLGRIFNRKLVRSCSGNSSRDNSGSQGGAFFFQLTILSTHGYPSRTRAPHIAIPLPSWR